MWLDDGHVRKACAAILGRKAIVRDEGLLLSGLARGLKQVGTTAPSP